MPERCSGVDAKGNRCRRAPWHVRDRLPHRWWTSQGVRQSSEWPISDEEKQEFREEQIDKQSPVAPVERRISSPATRALKSTLTAQAMDSAASKPADFRVKSCLECPLFDALLDRCQHPAMGKYGHDVSSGESGTLPIFCPLRSNPLTVEAAA